MDVIIINNGDGSVGILYRIGEASIDEAVVDVPVVLSKKCTINGTTLPAGSRIHESDALAAGASYKKLKHRISTTMSIPADKTFRAAWTDDNPTDTVDIDMTKAKLIAYDIRRIIRAEKFKPLDIEATIPAMATAAEAARQVIRDEDAILQANIDAATTPDELKILLSKYK